MEGEEDGCRGRKGGKPARADAEAGFADDGAVADYGDEDINCGGAELLVFIVCGLAVCVFVVYGFAICECAVCGWWCRDAIEGWELVTFVAARNGEQAFPYLRDRLKEHREGNLDSVEFLQDLKDTTTRARRVVIQLIYILWICKFRKSLTVSLIARQIRNNTKEASPRDRRDIQVVCQQGSQCKRRNRVGYWRRWEQICWDLGVWDETQWAVCYGGPGLELKQVIDILREVLGKERDRVARGVADTSREGNGNMPDVLPVGFRRDTSVFGDCAEEGTRTGDMDVRHHVLRG